MYKVRLTPAAKEQLKEIWHYSFDVWGEEKADAYLMDIKEKLRMLAENPGIGRNRPDIKPGYHSAPVNKHVIYYMLEEQNINVIGVLHERMDVRARLLD